MVALARARIAVIPAISHREAPVGSRSCPLEKKFVARWVNRVPFWLETHHLTLLTIPWTGLVIASAWQVRESEDIRWFWGVSLAIALQYLTDLFDGAVGRSRNTGLVKWGFYMDHFLDYVFQCGLIIGYALIAPPQQNLDWWFFGSSHLNEGGGPLVAYVDNISIGTGIPTGINSFGNIF